MPELCVLRNDALTIERQYRVVKVREVLQRLQQEGWVLRRQRASDQQFYHPSIPERRVTVAGHPHLDIPKGTLNSMFKQAGWK